MALTTASAAEAPGKASSRPAFVTGARSVSFWFGTITGDTSYPTGGEDWDAEAITGFRDIVQVIVSPSGGYEFEYVDSATAANRKIKAYARGRLGLSSDTIAITDDDNAASTGVAVYAHIDEVIEQGSYLAHLEAVTAGNADTYARLYTSGPTVAIQDDDNAASGGLAVYFDEDGTAGHRLLADFDRPADANVYVQLSDGRFLQIDDTDSPETPGVQVYVDDDAASDIAKLLFVSPTNTDGTDRIHEYGGEVEPATNLSAVTANVMVIGYR